MIPEYLQKRNIITRFFAQGRITSWETVSRYTTVPGGATVSRGFIKSVDTDLNTLIYDSVEDP